MEVTPKNSLSVEDAIFESARAGQLDLDDEQVANFSLDSPKAVLRRNQGASGTPRPEEPPQNRIDQFRAIRRTDPHVSEMVNTVVDYITGVGFNVAPANIPETEEGQTPEEVAAFKLLIERSDFKPVLDQWVDTALTDGTGFLEVVVEDEVFKPKVLPTKLVSVLTDEFGKITGYELDAPGTAEPIEFAPDEIAILRFFPIPGQSFGRSIIEPIQEVADMLRDMEIDYARFIETKAYPPVIWKLGDEDRYYSETQLSDWLDTMEDIQPESMIAVNHDVDHDVVGTTSTTSSSGAMSLEPVFKHLLHRIHAGVGVPPFLTGMDTDINRNTSVAVMPKFDRRIQRFRETLRHTIRYQVFVSILAGDGEVEDYRSLPPEFEFGEHSSEEERLETAEAIRMFQSGFLTRKAAAERMGIDPEMELPDEDELSEIVDLLGELAGRGDEIQNPNGGRPTEDGTGQPSSSGAAKGRQNPERATGDGNSRPQRDVTDE
ncbi:portal protein [Halorubrum tailed virus 27]|uniref:Portal protein n=1 Tax=Halorubrum tailed virus 27 TaxID=2878008 RepID=A0AAE8XYC1_9CAUD|nr:portal protein [Halorubrum tailed virus 27]UBF22700.1 portal protein [Halorubrum tailed virus 27]